MQKLMYLIYKVCKTSEQHILQCKKYFRTYLYHYLQKIIFFTANRHASNYHYCTVRWWCRHQKAIEWTPGHTNDWTVTRCRQYLSTAGWRPCSQWRRLDCPDQNTTLTGYCKHRSRCRPNSGTYQRNRNTYWLKML